MRCEFNLHPHLGPVIFCADCQLCQTTSTGPAEGLWDWQGPLGKANIKRLCTLISIAGPSRHSFFRSCFSDITHAASLHPLWLLSKRDAHLKGGFGRFSIHSFSLNPWAPDLNQLIANLFWTFRKGERGEHALCHFPCAQRIKCSRFNFIKSLTTGADTEDGKYARPENSQNPTVSISIKARCSTGNSNLIKPTNNKGFSLGSGGPRAHSSVCAPCGWTPGHGVAFTATPGYLWRSNGSPFVCGLL